MKLNLRRARAAWVKCTARDTRLERTVAIKILSTQLSDNPELKQREAHPVGTGTERDLGESRNLQH
jgi:hypothetical protein